MVANPPPSPTTFLIDEKKFFLFDAFPGIFDIREPCFGTIVRDIEWN